MHIAFEPADQPEVVALIEALDSYQMPMYPPESHHGVDSAALAAPNVLFAVARDEQGAAVGCAGMVLETDYGEVKRMFTAPGFRGRGVAGRLLNFLEAEAAARGCFRYALETGHLQIEAIALYERAGYVRCAPFGSYAEDPNSVFMAKDASLA